MNIKKYVPFILSCLLLLFAGCDRSNDEPTYEGLSLNVVSSDVVFSAAGGEGSIIIDHSGSVTAVSDSPWCTVSVNGQRISVNVTVHTDMFSRHALVTISDGVHKNFVTVSQYGFDFTLERYNASISAVGGEIRIGYYSDTPPTVSSSVGWITGTIDHAQRQAVLTVAPYFTPNVIRQGSVTLSVGAQGNTITVVQDGYIPSYSDFLGTYTMSYTPTTANAAAVPPIRNREVTVSLVQATVGSTYYLKGLLAPDDEALGNIVVRFDPAKGIVISGQLMFSRSNGWEFWLLPLGLNTDNGLVSSFASSTGLGMETTSLEVSAGLSFSMVDIGTWGTTRCVGFRLRNYLGTASQGDVPGSDGQNTFLVPSFVKQ